MNTYMFVCRKLCLTLYSSLLLQVEGFVNQAVCSLYTINTNVIYAFI